MALSKFFILPGVLAILCGFSTSTALAVSAVQAYAFSVAGQSTCGTWGPTDHMRYDYPGSFSGKYAVGTPGPGCSVQESSQYSTSASGSANASSSASSTSALGTYSGSSQASASYGQLGVSADGSYSGTMNTFTTRGAESFATFTESFNIAGAAGQYGYFVPTFTVDGSWNKTGSAAVQFEMEYRVNNNPTYLLYRIQSDINQPPSLWYNGYVNAIPGLSVGADSVTGSAQISIGPGTSVVPILFQFNQAFDLTIALYASVIPYPGSPSTGGADYLHTASMSGISILDSYGNVLPEFSISSGSGTVYDANGVHVVPVPAAAWLFVSGALGLFGVAGSKQA